MCAITLMHPEVVMKFIVEALLLSNFIVSFFIMSAFPPAPPPEPPATLVFLLPLICLVKLSALSALKTS
eukprot:CAMPEP_0182481244 /NCGR_PEP_ID=MMETSP1319-20130603/37048_1 /TAXON_ID=172717 /ORGANISM="Bolidomonas pacifica, Strain RCC208" /LENGTH=68 /DNA_ID=CAMNT_0024682841 /DNA_START=432 /DNA_END=635 /DNA_ORIENTATION=-